MIKLKPCLILILLVNLLVFSTGSAQISSTEIDSLVEKAMDKFNVVGVAVGIVKDGKIIHSKGYGLKSIETKEKANEHTNFSIASNTKAFTTAALSILVDEGKLSWQDRVKDYIPEFQMYNDYVTENFNIQDLLTHRSGLGPWAADLMILPDGTDFTIKDILNCFQYFEPASAFRTKWDYSNLLYIVAGEVIARVSGVSWEEFVKTRIMESLNMDNSLSSLTEITDRSNVATPHSIESGSMKTIGHWKFDPEKINNAAGSIFSNVDDLCNWMLVHLNKGKYGENLEKQLFSEGNQKEMWKIHTILEVNPNPRYNSHFAGYGLGWFLTDVKGNLLVSHRGSDPGMLSNISLIPDLNMGVVILTNTFPGGRPLCSAIGGTIYLGLVGGTIIDSYLGLDDFGWTDRIYDKFQKSRNKADSVTIQFWKKVKAVNDKHINVEDYTGVYGNKWFGKVEVLMNENQLWFKSYRSPKLNGPMKYYKAIAFAIKWEYQDWNMDAFAIFSLDEEGKAQSIRMKGISPKSDFPDLDFQRIEIK